jgi:uncharacterized protein YxjI
VPEQTPADWYPDPFGRHERRYWDGSMWTEHVASLGRQAVDPPVDKQPVPTAVTSQTPAGWYPDPFGRHERRYWDGSKWMEHVASLGRQAVDPPVDKQPVPTAVAPVPTVKRASKKVQREVRRASVAVGAQVGGGTLFTEPVLVVNQKAKLRDVNVDYAVYDQHGQQIGAVREVRQSIMKRVLWGKPMSGPGRTYRLQVVDRNGRVLIELTRPVSMLRSKMIVRDANGAEIGRIVQKNLGIFGGVRFALLSGGKSLGSMNGKDWTSWDFNLQDETGNEIARITKAWAGLAKERFTKADNYVVQIHRPLDEPLRSLVIAAALAVDIALKQGAQTSGSSFWGTRRYK